MTSVLTQALESAIDKVRYNPSAMQRVMLNALDQVMDGSVDIVDATNPFAFLMESSCFLASSAMLLNKTLARDQYPTLAQTETQVYKWMSDRDYINRFATPTKATFLLLLDKAELIAKAVDTGVNGVKQLTIPRNTMISVSGYEFTMQYPIDIRVMPYGGLQVTYDSSKPSPLQTLPSNIVSVKELSIEGTTFVMLSFDVYQMSVRSYKGSINLSTGFSATYNYTDYFYYVRAYSSDGAGNWNEIVVSYNPQVFDVNTPTVLATVQTGVVSFEIPQVYLTNQLVTNEVRLDIYTTKGPLSLQLPSFTTDQYVATWQDLDNNATSIYSAPLNNFVNKGINSSTVISGGSGPMPFEQLRAQVINNTIGQITRPITNLELGTVASNLGYGIVTNIDNITNRQYLVTRALPAPEDSAVVTGAGCTINTFQTTLNSLAGLGTVVDNGVRLTLLPSTLYRIDNGVVNVVTQSQIDAINALDLDTRVQQINAVDYLYTPFHYVLDTSNNEFDARPYFLDNPTVNVKAFVTENASTDITIATNTYQLVRTATGYQLQVVVKSSDTYKALPDSQCFAQLCFIPVGESEYAYLNGTLVGQIGGERVFGFNLDTNYDIDSANQLALISFSMYNEGPRAHKSPLDGTFQMIYGVVDYQIPGQVTSAIDTIVGDQLIVGTAVGVTQEVFEMSLGYALTALWQATRSVVSSASYARHTTDVPSVYPYDVFQTDPVTGVPTFTIDPGTQQPVFTILHHAGDPVLDAQGNPVYLNKVGDPILDGQGNPVQLLPRSVARQIDMLMVDGVYWWATAGNATTYRQEIPKTVVGWLQDDIAPMRAMLIEQSDMYFYPKATVGMVSVTTQAGVEVLINSEQSFKVLYYLSQGGYRNSNFTDTLRANTKNVLAKQLDKGTVTRDAIITALRSSGGSDVISVDLQGLGGSLNLTALTLVDDSMRLTIGKITQAMPDGTIGVVDDIDIKFLPFN